MKRRAEDPFFEAESDMDAARAAFASWRDEKWLDPRTNTLKQKTSHAWTIEQYGLLGFSVMYARKLHVPRVAAARQAVRRASSEPSTPSRKKTFVTPTW